MRPRQSQARLPLRLRRLIVVSRYPLSPKPVNPNLRQTQLSLCRIGCVIRLRPNNRNGCSAWPDIPPGPINQLIKMKQLK